MYHTSKVLYKQPQDNDLLGYKAQFGHLINPFITSQTLTYHTNVSTTDIR